MTAADLFDLLTGDLRHFVPQPLSEALLIVVSFLSGGLIGVERERHDKPAGLRTMMLITGGATIFTLASLSPAMGIRDPSRIAAQIVTGVGFLGAGAILRGPRGVMGLTTAASIWASAGVGLVIGAGFAGGGVALAVGIVGVLSVVSRAEARLNGRCDFHRRLILYRPDDGKTFVRVQAVIDRARGQVTVGEEQVLAPDRRGLPIRLCLAHKDHRALLAALLELPDIAGIETPPDDTKS